MVGRRSTTVVWLEGADGGVVRVGDMPKRVLEGTAEDAFATAKGLGICREWEAENGGQSMLILGGPCSPQGQVRHVADLFRQIRHGNRNKTAKYVFKGLYFVGEGL